MLIAVFWGNVDTRGTGTVWYHGSTDNALLSRASMEIRNAFPTQADAGFTATDLFIATWDRVGYYSRHTDLVCALTIASILNFYARTYILFRPTHFNVCLSLMDRYLL